MITGANMGGKSISLKTIVLNVVLAMCGFYVYADYAEIPFFREYPDDFRGTAVCTERTLQFWCRDYPDEGCY